LPATPHSALEHTFEYKPVGFIDNSLELEGSQIRGLRIYSPDSDVGRLIEEPTTGYDSN
jgi:FlaA1/EpsC-like NDP-sugar epimerase